MTSNTDHLMPPYWQPYAAAVADHIREYTIGQYSDWPHDKCTAYTVEDCLKQIDKYHLRHGKNVRPGEDARDLLKIGHYCAMSYTKITSAILETPPYGTVREAEWHAFCAVVAGYCENGYHDAYNTDKTKELTQKLRLSHMTGAMDYLPELALRTAQAWDDLRRQTPAPTEKLEFCCAMESAHALDAELKQHQDALIDVGFDYSAPVIQLLDRVFEFALERIAEQYNIHPEALSWFAFDNKYGAEKRPCIYVDDPDGIEHPIIDAATFWDFEKSPRNS